MGDFSGLASEIQNPTVVPTHSLHTARNVADPLPISVWIMDPRRTEADRTHAVLAEVRKAARHSHRSVLPVVYADDATETTIEPLATSSIPLAALTRRTNQERVVIALLFERQWQAALALIGALSLLLERRSQSPITYFVPILVRSDGGVPTRAATNLSEALGPFPFAFSLSETEIRVEHGGIVHIGVNVAATLKDIFQQVP